MSDRINVLIVDDSRLFRAALEDALAGQPDITVVGSVFSSAKSLEFIRATPPQVVTLDVEMPGMDGLATLTEIQAINQSSPASDAVGVIMVSAFTRRGADITVKALQAGAFDFVTKPSGPSPEANLASLRDELLPRIRACARQHRRTAATPRTTKTGVVHAVHPRPKARQLGASRAIVVGASTGGPRALSTLLPELCAKIQVPVLVVQHMPPDFTRSLAESLSRQTGRKVVEAVDGMPLKDAQVFIAPGGKHLLLRGSSDAPLVGLSDAPPENGCRPSADVLFRSAAAVFGRNILALILTGMGCDGTAGLQTIRRAGGYIIAQDEATSVVWGMPGSAVQAGLADEVRPLPEIASAAVAMFKASAAGD
ncbi:MAG: chemotaxis response regulator protein-glutamate methylesterase [Planctomycetes bacterium]|nr:chemotaxis response regulator protein-glutamate methylesterase [Planctomycetota bacterium]